MRQFLAALLLLLGTTTYAQNPTPPAPGSEQEKLLAEKNQVNSSCTEEAKAANCGDKVVGKGLLKCIHEYKKVNKNFKVSDACKSAIKDLREEKRKLRGK